MQSRTVHSANTCRRFLRAVVAHVMALTVLITFLVPHHAAACAPTVETSSAAITMCADDTDGSGDPTDFGRAQHAACASCPCHTGVWPSAEYPSVMASLDAPFPGAAEALPWPRPASLPFKPPRA